MPLADGRHIAAGVAAGVSRTNRMTSTAAIMTSDVQTIGPRETVQRAAQSADTERALREISLAPQPDAGPQSP